MRMSLFLSIVLVMGLIGASQRVSEAGDLSALLDKAIAAHGGADMLTQHKNKAIYTRSRGTIEEAETIPFVEETFGQPPDKAKKITELEIKGQKTIFMMVFNGDRAWLSFGGQVREANAAEQEGYKEGRNHCDVLDL